MASSNGANMRTSAKANRKSDRKAPKRRHLGGAAAAAPFAAAPSPSVHLDALATALQALDNTKTVSVRETKDGSTRNVVFDPVVLKGLRAMFPNGKTYRFRLASTVVPYPTDGSGNLLASTSFSPAVTSYPEWTGLSALFDEVNLLSARCTLVGGASSLKNIAFVVGYNPNNISTTPASTTAVANLNDSQIVSSYTTTSRIIVLKATIPRQRQWAETTVPAVASPPAGCVGTFDFANGGASGTVSSTYFYTFTEIVVVLRNRI